MKIINPATERVIRNLKTDTVIQIQEKFKFAKEAQLIWQKQSIDDRLETVKKFSHLLAKRQEKLAALLTQEMGKPIGQARGEIEGAQARINYFIENSSRYLTEEVVWEQPGLQEVISYEPLGVIANISAWNYPYLVGVNVFIPALIGGNAVLYKPSEHTQLTGLEIQRLWNQCGVPEGLFQTITGAGDAGQTLIDLPLQGYFFTGSYTTGQAIYEQVATKMVPCQMELGGKDPLYVAANNSKLKQAAAAAVDGAFYNNGQSCCAVERIYVHQSVYHDFINLFVQEVKQLKLGDPMDPTVYIGPLARKQQIDVLQDQIEDAQALGGKLLSGGQAETRQGYFFQPTVVINTNHNMKLMTEETFGPLIGIQQVKDDKEALTLMTDTPYGLTASVFSEDQQQAREILDQLPTGSGYWNCSDRVSARLPWSGRGHSGFGTTLSHLGIRSFVQPKGYHLKENI